MEAKPYFCFIQLNFIKWLIRFDLTVLRFLWAHTKKQNAITPKINLERLLTD